MFPFVEYWWFYGVFTAFVLAMLAIDLGVFHRRAHAVGFREAALMTAVWVTLAMLFAVVLYFWVEDRFGPAEAKRLTLEYLAGYVVEESLSVDNMFVFVVIFRYLGIGAAQQHRVLFYGILGALFFRACFIAMGAALLQFSWVELVFGVFLILTGIKMGISGGNPPDPDKNPVVQWLRKKRFSTTVVAIVVVEMTDIIFAIDSVPAIFALTREPLIVFTSNIFAILGLRSLYFMLGGAVERFHLLHYGLAAILIFVGIKMAWLNDMWGGHFPIGISLAVIAGVLGATIGLSLAFPKPLPSRESAP